MLIDKAKLAVKQLIRKFGYNVVKIPANTLEKQCPYIREFEVEGHRFLFWIANDTGVFWYDRESITQSNEYTGLLGMTGPGDRILEIGSHHGFFTMMLADTVGPEGFVVGLEAEPGNALIAQSQIILNRVAKQCLVIHAAGSDVSGYVTIATTDGSNAYAAKKSEAGTIQVKAVTGDESAREFGNFDLLKLDVEGFEANVLKGCREILATRPKLAIELHMLLMKRYGTTVQDVFEMIDVDQYRGSMIVPTKSTEIIPFDPDIIAKAPKANIFLEPIPVPNKNTL